MLSYQSATSMQQMALQRTNSDSDFTASSNWYCDLPPSDSGGTSYHCWSVSVLHIGWLIGSAKCVIAGSAYDTTTKTGTIFTAESYVELAVEIFITASKVIHLRPTAFEPAVKCITVSSHITAGEHVGGDHSLCSCESLRNYTLIIYLFYSNCLFL